MNDRLEQTIFKMVRTYLRSLSDSDFLALTCDLTILCTGLVRVVYDEGLRRQAQEINKPKKDQQFKYLTTAVAAIFGRTTRRIKQIINAKVLCDNDRLKSSACPNSKAQFMMQNIREANDL